VSSIFGSLSSTSAALEAQRRGLEVAGQNIANVNTAGYSRRTMILKERSAAEPGEVGRGVEVSQIRAVRDLFLETRVRQEQQALSRDQVVAEAMSVLEAQLGQPGLSVDGQLSAFFNSFSALSEDPASLTLRDAAVRESERVAASFREMASRFDQSRRDADVNVRNTVDEINRLTTDIAALNARISGGGGINNEAIIDSRNVLLGALADLTDITVSDASGTMTVSLASGQTLVNGTHRVTLDVVDEAGTGLARVTTDGQDITAGLTGGRIGGWIQVRDGQLPAYSQMLDRLAFTFATEANAVHASGTDALGNPGVPLFSVSATEAGAANSLALSAGVAADARLIVAEGASANDAARAMAALRDGSLVDGASTLSDYWGQIVYRIGGDTSAAERVQQGRQQVMNQLQQLREATSGVSLDEEAASLMRYQRAYEANARYFTIVNDVLDVLMGMVR
jgi:flagellar hook-associated protein 1 FlgK